EDRRPRGSEERGGRVLTLNFGSVISTTRARPLRIDCPGGVYHVTARGSQRRTVVHDDEDRAHWVRFMDRVASRFEWRIFAWALMRNHRNLFLSRPSQISPVACMILDSLSGYSYSGSSRAMKIGLELTVGHLEAQGLIELEPLIGPGAGGILGSLI